MMSGMQLTVVKVGGKPAEDDLRISLLGDELRLLTSGGRRVLLVHGGGITISSLQEKYGVEPVFVNGLRQTPPAEMPIVDMALSGAVNKRIVRLLRTAGVNAWGICGADAGIISAESESGTPEENRTGKVISVDIRPLNLLWNNGYVPVLAPPATDSSGRAINVNADQAALALSAALQADHLVFISDVPGVMDKSETIRSLTPEMIEKKIGSEIITGGMIPKVIAASEALGEGIGSVYIGDYSGPNDLVGILTGKRGTCINSGAVE